MEFYERYSRSCARKGINPVSQTNADLFGVSKSAITNWKRKNIVPNGATIALIANELGVSADYLLCRTDDPTDYTGTASRPAQNQASNCNAQKSTTDQMLDFLTSYNRLDAVDRAKLEGFVQGLLANDKYKMMQNLA